MADVKKEEKGTPFFTTEKVTLFAPKGAKHYEHMQEISVQARQKPKFLKLGFTETKEEAAESEAHAAIAVASAPQKPAKGRKAETESDAGTKEPA
ncbi:MAG TPA: hypothetical protein VGN00_14260 [Puia sp.]|jgi:hypothetical protein